MDTNIKDKVSLRNIYLKMLKNVSKNNYQKWNKTICKKFNESHYFKQNNVLIFKKSLDEIKKVINLT